MGGIRFGNFARLTKNPSATVRIKGILLDESQKKTGPSLLLAIISSEGQWRRFPKHLHLKDKYILAELCQHRDPKHRAKEYPFIKLYFQTSHYCDSNTKALTF